MNGRVHELSYLGYYLGQVCTWSSLLINPVSGVLTFVAILTDGLGSLRTDCYKIGVACPYD